MTPSLGWLVALAATYPWVLANDLLADALASWHLFPFLGGALLVTPMLRLRLPQCLLFAACLGFLIEATRPFPPGSVAFALMTAAALADAWREPLRRRSRHLLGALANAGIALAALAAAGWQVGGDWAAWAWSVPVQVALAGLLGWLVLAPAAALQAHALARAGFHEIRET